MQGIVLVACVGEVAQNQIVGNVNFVNDKYNKKYSSDLTFGTIAKDCAKDDVYTLYNLALCTIMLSLPTRGITLTAESRE